MDHPPFRGPRSALGVRHSAAGSSVSAQQALSICGLSIRRLGVRQKIGPQEVTMHPMMITALADAVAKDRRTESLRRRGRDRFVRPLRRETQFESEGSE